MDLEKLLTYSLILKKTYDLKFHHRNLSEIDVLEFHREKNTDTEVLLLYDINSKELIFSFRGTEINEIKDIEIDLMAWPIRPKFLNYDKSVKIHAGFSRAYKSVRRWIFQKIEEHNAIFDSVVFIGHSLGGALAHIGALDVSLKNDYSKKVICRSFASPKIGNKRFRRLYSANVDDSLRVLSAYDPIVILPPWFIGYRHVPIHHTLGNNYNFYCICNYVQFIKLFPLRNLKISILHNIDLYISMVKKELELSR